jgi:LysM repeat protein
MAEIEAGEQNLIMRKYGPLPGWAWATLLLAAAWAYAKYRSSKTSSTSSTDSTDTTGTSDDSSETDAVAPQFVIENNLPAGGGASAPIAPVTSTPTPVVTPPGTTTAPPVSGTNPVVAKPGPITVAPSKPAAKKPISYKVVHGDTLTSIAKKYHTTAAALYTYNTTAGVRPAATIATLKKRGPNLIVAGETILIPQ